MESLRRKLLKEVTEEASQKADVSAKGHRDKRPKQEGAEARTDKADSRKLSYLLPEEERQKSDFQGSSKESLVSTSTEDTLFQKEESSKVYPLTMTWSFGWNSLLPVYYIRNNQRVILYVCAHNAGHPNIISCICVSEDRRWIATADKGPDCLIIIWDSFTGIPVHTIFDSCPEGNGIRSIAISHDAKFLATISDAEIQNYLIFNPRNDKELVSNSQTQVTFYSWVSSAKMQVTFYSWTFNKLVGKFSQSVFHLKVAQMLSATKEGKLVVWDIHYPPSSSSMLAFPFIKPCKLVHLQKEAITVLTTIDSYIVTGDIKGNIKFYDHSLSIINWYCNFKLGAIRTLSFSKVPPSLPTEKSNFPIDCTLKGDLFVVRNFIIGTFDATVYHMTADGTKLEKLFVEPRIAVHAISCHPYQPLIAVGSVCGMIKVWNYEKKVYLFSRVFEKGLGVQSLTYNSEENEIPQPFRYSRTSVSHVSFSHDSNYMATASYKDHLEVLDIHRTDQGTYPTCMIWYPPLAKELFLLICNSCYKVKLFNSTTKMCRKTLLGPAYGSPIEYTQVLPVKNTFELQKRHLVFINKDKVGLQILPVDGNPHKTCAIVCHPDGVSGMTLSYDGRYAFTAGGQDCSVVQWEINLSALEAAVSLGGEDLTPFYGLVSGGREGKFYRELEDYFYYSQIRSQGIDTMETRQVSEYICLSELPFVMRAIGFYPSEEKVGRCEDAGVDN
ncbi:hypothetical protein A6R68_18519 [Neotoma lepida]|uniref:Cilia- and flagella-associated protein 251 n=1 Tax=Neotoma lepida TaxID=56216 RepID=A0A1A6HLE6_NEOLE|nr:hypothetical protein A6R68_18519 [Neotoma lepida]